MRIPNEALSSWLGCRRLFRSLHEHAMLRDISEACSFITAIASNALLQQVLCAVESRGAAPNGRTCSDMLALGLVCIFHVCCARLRLIAVLGASGAVSWRFRRESSIFVAFDAQRLERLLDQ